MLEPELAAIIIVIAMIKHEFAAIIYIMYVYIWSKTLQTLTFSGTEVSNNEGFLRQWKDQLLFYHFIYTLTVLIRNLMGGKG